MIRNHYEQLNIDKLNNGEETGKILGTYDHPRLNYN